MKPTLAILLALLGLSAVRAGQNLSLAWDVSPGTNIVGYVLYACINATLEYPISHDAGTNRTVTISGLTEDTVYWLYCKPYYRDTTGTNWLAGEPSNVLVVGVPKSSGQPENFRTLIVEESIDLTNWSPVTFWRLKIGP